MTRTLSTPTPSASRDRRKDREVTLALCADAGRDTHRSARLDRHAGAFVRTDCRYLRHNNRCRRRPSCRRVLRASFLPCAYVSYPISSPPARAPADSRRCRKRGNPNLKHDLVVVRNRRDRADCACGSRLDDARPSPRRSSRRSLTNTPSAGGTAHRRHDRLCS